MREEEQGTRLPRRVERLKDKTAAWLAREENRFALLIFLSNDLFFGMIGEMEKSILKYLRIFC